MTRDLWIKWLLTRWFYWRNRNRTASHCALNIENDVVDQSRASQDLINAAGVDFKMIRLERIINNLPPDLRDAVYAVYGQKEWIGYSRAAELLSVHRNTIFNRLSSADKVIKRELENTSRKND